MTDELGRAFWEERYAHHASDHAEGGPHPPRHHLPNASLVSEADELPPGLALDPGCGQGTDAVWLASRGWRVTAVDFVATALQRAREYAATRDAEVAGRIDWVEADLTTWTPTERRFDLVSSQYVHLPAAPRAALFRRLAAAVAPGGTLLLVGHHPSDRETSIARGEERDLYLTAEDAAVDLDPGAWEILVSEARPRPATDPQGRAVTVHDAVLVARRRGVPAM